jgi:hypothetical protein
MFLVTGLQALARSTSILGKDFLEGYRKKFRLALLHPFRRRRALAFWTTSIPARIVRWTFVPALLASVDMPAEFHRPAYFDRLH